jgi:hypothetical protein
MIRPTDYVTTAAWVRPASAPSASDGVDSTNWFNSETPQANAHITGDVSARARGLTAEQHALRVLSHLSDDAAA